MFKTLKKWLRRKKSGYKRVVLPSGGPYREPGRPYVPEEPTYSGDKWLAVCEREHEGKPQEYVLGIIEGPEEVAMEKAQVMMVNYMFQRNGLDAVMFGNYGLVPMSDEEFEATKRKIQNDS